MPVTNPNELVEAFKTSGEYTRLRRELLTEFQDSDRMDTFKTRIEDIVKKRLLSDQKLKYLTQEQVHRELMQEVERFPVVERSVGEVRSLTDGSLLSTVQSSATRILQESKTNVKSKPEKIPPQRLSATGPPEGEPTTEDRVEKVVVGSEANAQMELTNDATGHASKERDAAKPEEKMEASMGDVPVGIPHP